MVTFTLAQDGQYVLVDNYGCPSGQTAMEQNQFFAPLSATNSGNGFRCSFVAGDMPLRDEVMAAFATLEAAICCVAEAMEQIGTRCANLRYGRETAGAHRHTPRPCARGPTQWNQRLFRANRQYRRTCHLGRRCLRAPHDHDGFQVILYAACCPSHLRGH